MVIFVNDYGAKFTFSGALECLWVWDVVVLSNLVCNGIPSFLESGSALKAPEIEGSRTGGYAEPDPSATGPHYSGSKACGCMGLCSQRVTGTRGSPVNLHVIPEGQEKFHKVGRQHTFQYFAISALFGSIFLRRWHSLLWFYPVTVCLCLTFLRLRHLSDLINQAQPQSSFLICGKSLQFLVHFHPVAHFSLQHFQEKAWNGFDSICYFLLIQKYNTAASEAIILFHH